jgi:hypothetical protein
MLRRQNRKGMWTAILTSTAIFGGVGCTDRCWSGCSGKALTDAARDAFHRRWSTKQFHDIYVMSELANEKREAAYVTNWTSLWDVTGPFQDDKEEVHAFQDSGNDNSTTVTKYYNARYGRTMVVEEFQWRVKDNRATLRMFSLKPHRQMRCQSTLLSTACETITVDGAAARR